MHNWSRRLIDSNEWPFTTKHTVLWSECLQECLAIVRSSVFHGFAPASFTEELSHAMS